MIRRLRLALARHRLRGHMYDRLIYGGSPECPCGRCDSDRASVLDLTGDVWNDPEKTRWYRAHSGILDR